MHKKQLDDVYARLKELDEEELKELVIRLLEENDQLKKDVFIDHLTNIYNRKVLTDDIKYDVLVMCDVDNFKCINDTYGHQVGDELLKNIAKKLSKVLRSEDILLRYGGDEFTILFQNCYAEDIKHKLEAIKESDFYKNDLNIKVTMSFGITEYSEGKSIEEAISEADCALYMSKQKGKNSVSIYKKIDIKEYEKAI